MQDKDLCEVREFEGVGAEKFAEHAWRFADKLVPEMTDDLVGVKVQNVQSMEQTVRFTHPSTTQKIPMAE